MGSLTLQTILWCFVGFAVGALAAWLLAVMLFPHEKAVADGTSTPDSSQGATVEADDNDDDDDTDDAALQADESDDAPVTDEARTRAERRGRRGTDGEATS